MYDEGPGLLAIVVGILAVLGVVYVLYAWRIARDQNRKTLILSRAERDGPTHDLPAERLLDHLVVVHHVNRELHEGDSPTQLRIVHLDVHCERATDPNSG